MIYFVGQVLPYAAAAVFLIGMARCVLLWLHTPVPFHLRVNSKTSRSGGTVDTIEELLVFKSLFKGEDKSLWFWAWMMHIALFMIIGGHIMGITYLGNEFVPLGLSAKASQILSGQLGSIFGLLAAVGLAVLLYRRTAVPEVKALSNPAEFFDILLLLLVVITGLHMRLTTIEVDLESVRAYMIGLLTLHPIPIPNNSAFIAHFFLVNILLLCFPFSKLVHFAGFFVNRIMLNEAAPVYPTPQEIPVRHSFLLNSKPVASSHASVTKEVGQ